MTKVHLYGILGKVFGNFFEFKINNGFSALKAIDANREGFFKKIKELSLSGVHYQIIINGEIVDNENKLIEKRCVKDIYVIPIIYGSGEAVAQGLNLVITEGAKAGALTATGQMVAFAVNTAISIGISLAVALLTAGTSIQGSTPQPQGVGGASAAVEARGKSFVFSNVENVASQGDPIPIGYGKVKCGSKIIYGSTKSYPTNISNTDEFLNLNLTDILFDEYSSK